MRGKSIEIFLVDGTAENVVTAELSNWNGKSIKIPRTEVETCTRDDVRDIGVYFLISQEVDGTDSVYIGESENVLERLKQHIIDFKNGKEKYYWNAAVIFTGRDLNKALIRYLENKLVGIAKSCGRYSILTKNTYKNTKLKESQIASMDEFTDNIKVLLNTLGYKVLVPMPKAKENTVYFNCQEAKGFLSVGGFTVIENSKISDSVAASFEKGSKSYFNLRITLIEEGIIKNGIFQKSYEFKSPSAASSVVLGRSSNGQTEWKDKNGKLLNEY